MYKLLIISLVFLCSCNTSSTYKVKIIAADDRRIDSVMTLSPHYWIGDTVVNTPSRLVTISDYTY